MRVLVLGGSGFVGSHVADALSEAGHDVTIFDALESRWLRDDQRFVAGDITELDDVTAAVAGQEAVYNFAGLADIDESRNKPLDTVRINVAGNANVLEAARRADIGRYVFASSIYVASEAGSFYRVSKQACELYIEEYRREFGVPPYTILRYGTLYGRRATDTNSVHRYLGQALRERRITARGTGEELREYIHVEDAARLSVEVLAEEFIDEQVVLTGNHHLHFGEFLKLIREIVGADVELDLRPPAPEDELPSSAHYAITPYTFRPRVARKLVSNYYTDIGQGLVDCLHEIHELEQRAAS
ncbi:MAG: NAD(P)-dependent oxidoreductase [Thermoleophilaceae bacterium]